MKINNLTAGDLLLDFLRNRSRKSKDIFPVTGVGGEIDFVEERLQGKGRVVLRSVVEDQVDSTVEIPIDDIDAAWGNVATALFRWRFLSSKGGEDSVMPFTEVLARAEENDPSNDWHVEFYPDLDEGGCPVVHLSHDDCDDGGRKVLITVSLEKGCEGNFRFDAGIMYPEYKSTGVELEPNDPLANKPFDLEEGSAAFAGRIHEILEDLRPLSIPVPGSEEIALTGGAFPAVPERCFTDVQQFFAWLAKRAAVTEKCSPED
ncbi:MAG: hypothetical protein WC846_00300 [Candidatus Gracilibacteria bacterium]|jgi:hypothetical protein